jgi:excinuclease ABC subunit B
VADGDYATRLMKQQEVEMEHLAAEPLAKYYTAEELEKQIKATQKAMEKAAKDLDFIEAARLRDVLFELKAKQ